MLIGKGIFNIFYNNKITIEEIIKIINKKVINSDEEIKEEIKLLKKMILEKELENKNQKNNFIKINEPKNKREKTKNMLKHFKENKKEEKIKILSITGANGARKNNNIIFISA